MKIVIPLLSKQENNEDFLEKAVEGAKEIIVLLVIDTEAMPGQFGYAATEIRHGNMLIEEIKERLEEKKKQCNDIIEWGNTLTKIDHIARLQKADKIVLQKQENKFFKDLVKELKKEGQKVEVI